MSKRTVDRIGGFDENLRRYEDWDYLLRIARVCRVSFVPAPLAVVFMGDTWEPEIALEATKEFVKKNLEEFSSYGTVHCRRALSVYASRCAFYCALLSRRREAMKWLARAFVYFPFSSPLRLIKVLLLVCGNSKGKLLAEKLTEMGRGIKGR